MHFPSTEHLKARSTRKWTTYDADILPAWIAESDFATFPGAKNTIRRHVETESFGYTPAHHKVPTLLADFYSRHYEWRPDPSGIVLVPDVVRGLTIAVQHLTRDGSAVIVPTPSYPPFLSIPETAGREIITIDAIPEPDLDAIKTAFRSGAGSILLCSPNNPFGYTLSKEYLTQLCELAQQYGARVLVDEIHAPLVYQGQHTVAASLDDTAATVCVTITSCSKAFNIAGLKCAQIIFSNPDDLATWNKLNGVIKDGVGTLGVFAAETCYREGDEFLADQNRYLRENRDFLLETLPATVNGLETSKPSGTYLMWLDFRNTRIADDPAGILLRRGKIALNDGRAFGPGGAGHARLNFATSKARLEEIVDRIETGARASN